MNQPETFWTLVFDIAHWELELFIMFVVDGLFGLLIYPRIKRFWTHHKDDDDKLAELEKNVAELRKLLGLDPFIAETESKSTDRN